MRLLLLAALAVVVSPALAQAGGLDPAFGTGGRTIVDLGDDDVARVLALGSDGRAVLAGQTGNADGRATSIAVARFVTDGRPAAAEVPAATGGLALAEAGAARVTVDVLDAR